MPVIWKGDVVKVRGAWGLWIEYFEGTASSVFFLMAGVWNACEDRLQDDSRILACGAVKMELLSTEMVKIVGGAGLGRKTRGLTFEQVVFEKLINYPEGDVE